MILTTCKIHFWYYYGDVTSDALTGDGKALESDGEVYKGDRKVVTRDGETYKMRVGHGAVLKGAEESIKKTKRR